MDEFEKIKTFSESLNARDEQIAQTQTQEAPKIPIASEKPDLPEYLSQFRAVPAEEEQESKRMLWFILGLCVVIAGGTIFALTLRLPEMEESEIMVISPTPNPVKVQPENPGGLRIPDTDKVVYRRADTVAPEPVVESLFPEPERPLLPTEVIEPVSTEEKEVKPEMVVVNDAQQVADGLNVPLFEETAATVTDPVVEKIVETKPEPVKEVISEKTMEKPVKKGPVWRAQLLSSANKSKVESSWKQILQKQKALLSDMPYQIVSATIAGKRTFWRLQVGEFSTKEQVVNLCAKLKKRKQDCIPVK